MNARVILLRTPAGVEGAPRPAHRPAPPALSEPSKAVVAEHVIGIALGILLVQRRCTPHRAMGVLIDRATRADRSITDEAHRLVRAVATPALPAPTLPAPTATTATTTTPAAG